MNIDEQDEAETLMLRHREEAGTTSVCRCGYNGYSTSGYLLHLYEVVQADVEHKLGAMPIAEMIDRLFKAVPGPGHPRWRYQDGKPPKDPT